MNVSFVRIVDIDTTERKEKRNTDYVGYLENHKDADFENNVGTTIQILLKSGNLRRVANTHITATIMEQHVGNTMKNMCNIETLLTEKIK